MSETLDILTDEKRCRDCLEFDQLRFLENGETRIKYRRSDGNPCHFHVGWCKEQSVFTGPDWGICGLFKERKVSDETAGD